MDGVPPRDGDRVIDWGMTSGDYAVFRPGLPASFFERISALGLGQPGQRVLDLGTGTGNIARWFASRGSSVVGVDIAQGQIEQARLLAESAGLDIDFRVRPAEETGLPDAAFDVITACQCWLYFDLERMLPEIHRLLAPEGRLMTCHFSWLPRKDAIARMSEELVLRHNPDWSAGDWHGRVPAIPSWAAKRFELAAMFWYDEAIPFTIESWRGRIRACRGVGATLDPAQVAAFDADHDALLRATVAEPFTVLHRIDAHVVMPSAAGRNLTG